MSDGFTPGPWHVDGFNEVVAGDQCMETMIVSKDEYIVAQMVPERDADLIAAAPDMFEALEAATGWLEGAPAEVGRLLSRALAKARGEA